MCSQSHWTEHWHGQECYCTSRLERSCEDDLSHLICVACSTPTIQWVCWSNSRNEPDSSGIQALHCSKIISNRFWNAFQWRWPSLSWIVTPADHNKMGFNPVFDQGYLFYRDPVRDADDIKVSIWDKINIRWLISRSRTSTDIAKPFTFLCPRRPVFSQRCQEPGLRYHH